MTGCYVMPTGCPNRPYPGPHVSIASPMRWTRSALVRPGVPGGLPATRTTRSPLSQRPMSCRAASAWRTMSSVCATSGTTNVSANRPSRILGPCRSTSTPTLWPLASPAARTLRYAAWWLAWLPWLMLSRATSSPAATSAATKASHLTRAAALASGQRAGGRRDRHGQRGGAHQVGIHRRRRRTALGDRPHDQRLPAPHVARHEHAGDRCRVGGVPRHVAPLVHVHAQVVEQPRPVRTGETHGEQDQVSQ